MPSDPTARQRAMAEAIKAKEAELMRREAWDAAGRHLELARAADVAAEEYRLNLGDTGPRIYLVGGVPVTDGTATMGARAADKARDEYEKHQQQETPCKTS